MRVERDWLRTLVFGSDESRRFTQDSPILPDVWLVAGLFYCADRAARVDLLLTAFQKGSPSEIAAVVRQRLDTMAEPAPAIIHSESRPLEEESIWSGGRAERRVVLKKYRTVAVNQTNVVAALTLEELIIAVLPLTSWWRRN